MLVHGEFERNDMVQYFHEQLAGFAFTKHGWVQSYGSRYVRPQILFGDVSRPVSEMAELLALARERLADRQIWINPDCGLKTRKWDEVRPALVNMVAAAREVRSLIR